MFHPSDAARRMHRTPGQLRSRVDELKNPWRQGTPPTLSHNESARLATDALLEHGEDAYLKALAEEKELPFLSTLDIEYVRNNTTVQNGEAQQHAPWEEHADEDCLSQQTSGTYFPLMSDIDAPMLELGWPEFPPITRHSPTEVTVHFQRDRSNSIKDLLRSAINKAKLVIAIVMDLFTDVDILCDLVAAASKRRVPVYLLLDEKNLGYFIEMWEKLDLKSIKVPNLKVRTVTGSTYCTKSGKKFSGQFLEKFILIDCEQVIAGTYSFSWISSQVHSHMVTLFIGKIVEDFDTEFRCLYATSNIVDYFYTDELRTSPYSRPGGWNAQQLLRSAQIHAPVLSNDSDSQSTSTISSLKTSPYATSTIYKALHEDKRISSSFVDSERREVNGGLNVNAMSPNRRQSTPTDDSVGLRGRSNLGVITSLFSKSTPTLNQFEPMPHFNHPTIAEANILQMEYKRPTEIKTDRTFNSSARANHLDGENNGTGDAAGYEFNSHNGKLSRSDNRNTLGHSHLDMMMNYRRGPNGGTRGLHADNQTSTTVKSNVSNFQADTANRTENKNSTKDQSGKLNEDVNRRTLGHSKLDLMAKFRPQPTNSQLAEHKTPTTVKVESSLNHFNNANGTESKKDICSKPNGLKGDLRKPQNSSGSDENTRTLGHSRLDMITNGRPSPTTAMSALQPEYKTTPTTVNSDSSCNLAPGVIGPDSKEDTFPAPVTLRDHSKDSKNINRNDKRMTLGHSKLDMITSASKAKSKQAYSRFTPTD